MYFHAEKQEGGEKEGFHNPHLSPAGSTSIHVLPFLTALYISVFLYIINTIAVFKPPNYENLNHVAC